MFDGAPSRDVYAERFVLTRGSDAVRHAQETLLGAVEAHSYDAGSQFAIRLALEEAVSNAFKHGNKNDPRKVVRVHCRIDPHTVVIDVEDEGEGFDPTSIPDPTERENLEIPCGRGIVLMRSFMTNVQYDPPGNRVRMTFERKG